jgi:hypothetical protein
MDHLDEDFIEVVSSGEVYINDWESDSNSDAGLGVPNFDDFNDFVDIDSLPLEPILESIPSSILESFVNPTPKRGNTIRARMLTLKM